MKRFCWVISFILTIVVGLFGQKIDVGARPVGLGGGFVAISDDGNSPGWNPAGMATFQERALSFSFAKRLWGIENDNIMEGYLGYVHHFGKRGRYGSMGLFYEQLFTNVYYESGFGIGYSKLIWGRLDASLLSFGLNLKLLRYGFNEKKFEGVEQGDPVLSGATSRIAPAFDFGLIHKAKKFSIGITGKNLNQPDLSLSKVSNKTGKVPLQLRFGTVYRITETFAVALDIEYSAEKIAGKTNMSFHGGMEKWFGSNLGVRGGYNRNEAALGVSYILNRNSYDISFDYAFVYPFEYSALNVTTHKFSVGLKLAPPRIPVEDLEVVDGKLDISPYEVFLGNEITMRAKIINRGEKTEKNVPISIYYREPSGRWQIIMLPQPIDLEPGEIKELVYKWIPDRNGEFTVFISVNDDGSRLPRLHPKFEEEDFDNNTGSGKFIVYLPTTASVEPQQHRLEVSKMTIYQEEEPIIPMIFFASNSTSIDNRFNRIVQTIVSRLNANPSVILQLRGYYDSNERNLASDPTGLAYARAESVKAYLVSSGAPADRIIVVREGYDPSFSRSGRPDIQLNPRDKALQHEENRRVELATSVKDFDQFVIEFKMDSDVIPSEGVADIENKVDLYRKLLDSNPEIVIMVEGLYLGKGKEEEQMFMRAASVAKFIRGLLPPELAERVYLITNKSKDNRAGMVSIYPDADGVIYRPREGDRIIEDYSVVGKEENFVKISAKIDAGVDSFALSIIDEKGERVRLLAAGKGELPNGLGWDWRDEQGNLLDFDKKYFCKLDIWDKLGERVSVRSDTMEIEITKSGKRIETLVIVEFLFNEDLPQSKFLESRVEFVARRFIARAEKMPTKLYAYVKGHTDIIGAEYANIALSQLRAKRELENLKKYMMYLLGLKSTKELDDWLEAHNVELKAIGLWEKEPYTIVQYKDGKPERVLLGDNSKPEGRSINRRVILELRSERTIETP